MKNTLKTALLVALTLTATSQVNAKDPSGRNLKPALIPAPFLGEWNEDSSACGTANNDSKLVIKPGVLYFYESQGHVRKIVQHNPEAITVTMSFSGEGQVWDDTSTFVLWGTDGLSTGSGNEKFIRYRCPAKQNKARGSKKARKG